MTYSDKIILKGMRFYGYHGLFPAERELGQWFEADLELTLDLSSAGESDAIGNTVNYAEVYAQVKALMEGPPVDLIETLASKLLSIGLGFSQVEKAKVLLKKPQAPLGGPLKYAAVELERRRGDPL